MRTLTLMALAVVVLGWGHRESVAGAITGRNVSTDIVIFSDDGFENDTAGNPPNAPAIGTWITVQGGSGGPALVTDAPSPGVYDGTNYFVIDRAVAGESPRPQLGAVFSSPVEGSDVLEFTFAYNILATSGLHLSLENDLGFVANITNNATDFAWNMYNAEFSVGGATTLPVSGSGWQEVGVRYAADGSLFELTVAGTTESYAFGTLPSGPVTRIDFRTNNGAGPFYIDGIPGSSPVLVGDLNDDGFVGQDDLNLVLASWGQTVSAGDPADPNDDLFVGQDDLNPVLADWGQGTPPEVGSLSAVPEQDTLLLAAVAGVCCIVYGLRRHKFVSANSTKDQIQ